MKVFKYIRYFIEDQEQRIIFHFSPVIEPVNNCKTLLSHFTKTHIELIVNSMLHSSLNNWQETTVPVRIELIQIMNSCRKQIEKNQ